MPLPLKEFDLLELLMRNAGRVLTRVQLIDRVWGSDYVGDTKTLDVHVKRLRAKIEADPGAPARTCSPSAAWATSWSADAAFAGCSPAVHLRPPERPHPLLSVAVNPGRTGSYLTEDDHVMVSRTSKLAGLAMVGALSLTACGDARQQRRHPCFGQHQDRLRHG